MPKFNHFSIVDKTFDEKFKELESLGFQLKGLSEKEIIKEFLVKAKFDLSSLQATQSSNLLDFLESDESLTWNIFWTIALQLQGYLINFEFQAEKALDFAKSLNLPMLENQESLSPSAANIISALYLLLLTRCQNGMTLIELLVSEDLIPADNQFHFFNDKSLATFDMSKVKREVVWVESPVDTEHKGSYDLIKVQIHRPEYKGQLPVVMTASPYHLGINVIANDKQLHKMEGELEEKTAGKITLEKSQLQLPDYEKEPIEESSEATEHFTHGWTSTLNDYMLARGFASVYVAGVGTKDSDGFQTSGDYQQVRSMTAVIDWLNGRVRAFTSPKKDKEVKANWANGKVAMTGKSYLGTMSYAAATTGIEGLEVIVAESGISSWYGYYREGGLVRSPGGYPGEDLDVLAQLTYSRNMNGADYLAHNDKYQNQLDEMTQSLDRPTGDYNQYWEDRNYLPHVDQVKADVLIVHGLQDWNVTPDQAYHYWKALPENVTKHAFLHRGAHIYMNNWQSIDFSETLNTYFSAKLLSRPLNLDLAPIILQENDQAQSFKTIDDWGMAEKASYPLGENSLGFENHYAEEDFVRYGKDFEAFKKELFAGKIEKNSAVIDFKLPEDIEINGPIELELKLKVSDSKGLLSAQILDFGPGKRVADSASNLALNALDRGRNFKYENLQELAFKEMPYLLLSKGFLNLQNRKDLLEIEQVPAGEWMNFKMTLQPTIYKLTAGQTLRIILYSTDFEHTVRDNRDCHYEIDLAESKIILPHA